MSDNCETCRAPAPIIERGPFAGSRNMLDYCAVCSKDLCDDCLANGRCRETPDGKHVREDETAPADAPGGAK